MLYCMAAWHQEEAFLAVARPNLRLLCLSFLVLCLCACACREKRKRAMGGFARCECAIDTKFGTVLQKRPSLITRMSEKPFFAILLPLLRPRVWLGRCQPAT